MPSLGVVTIGQSPRTDLTGELAGYLPAGTSLLERGALDDLSPSAITALGPDVDDDTLTSRLRDGTSVVLDAERLLVSGVGAVAGQNGPLGVVVPLPGRKVRWTGGDVAPGA